MQVERGTQQTDTTPTAGGSTGATVALGATAKCATNANVESQQRHRRLQDFGTLQREDFDGEPVSVDEIEPGLYLGKLSGGLHWHCTTYPSFLSAIHR